MKSVVDLGAVMLVCLAAAGVVGATSAISYPICHSPCEDVASSDASPGTTLPACTITQGCSNLGSRPVSQSPAGPQWVDLQSTARLGPDDKTYLDIEPVWQPSPDRIHLLQGYQVKVMCGQMPCSNEFFCVTVTFNRTLTAADSAHNFSVNCLNGNFSQPEMQYYTIVRSLPNSDDDTNKAVREVSLPSCKEEESVSLCSEGPETWEPSYKTLVEVKANGSVSVTFWPLGDKEKVPRYIIYLRRLDVAGEVYQHFIDVREVSYPTVYFDNIPEGVYDALVTVDDMDCDCTLFKSANNVTVFPATEAPVPVVEPTLREPWVKPSVDTSISENPQTLSLAALAGGLGGLLGVILLLLLVFYTRRCKMASLQDQSSSVGGKGGRDGSPRAAMLRNNMQYDDSDSIQGTAILGSSHFGSMATAAMINGHSDYYSGGYPYSAGLDNPSMIPQTAQTDWTKHPERLLQESDNYADKVGCGKGDSISTVAVDIHPMSTTKVPLGNHRGGVNGTTLPKLLAHQSSIPYDSGVESACSDALDEDGQTCFSFALEEIGEEV